MPTNDYGLFIQDMRKARGFTQEQLASLSGVSPATIQKLEYSGKDLRIRASNLDAILTAIAMRGPLSQDEIQSIAEGTGRRPESIEALNTKASTSHNEPARSVREDKIDLTPMERLAKAFKVIESAGQSELALTHLEDLAKAFKVPASQLESARELATTLKKSDDSCPTINISSNDKLLGYDQVTSPAGPFALIVADKSMSPLLEIGARATFKPLADESPESFIQGAVYFVEFTPAHPGDRAQLARCWALEDGGLLLSWPNSTRKPITASRDDIAKVALCIDPPPQPD